jgi:hypothetical protein
MSTRTQSPLSLLVQSGLGAIGFCAVAPAERGAPDAPSHSVEQIAAGLLVSMGIGEIAEDLDLKAIALLGAASVAGLQAIEMMEPGLHRLETALFALEDLLRRTAPGAVR